MSDQDQQIADFLQSEEFYELMQAYRFVPVERPADVVRRFEDVKTAILSALRAVRAEPDPSITREGYLMACERAEKAEAERDALRAQTPETP